MKESVHALTLELLSWIEAHSSASYGEVMDVWRTSCPRHSVWEDAVIAGMIAIIGTKVTLTPAGKALLDRMSKSRTASQPR